MASHCSASTLSDNNQTELFTALSSIVFVKALHLCGLAYYQFITIVTGSIWSWILVPTDSLPLNIVMKTRYFLRIAPINDVLIRLAGCKAYENKPYPIFLTLYGSKNQTEKVASIWAYMFCRNSNPVHIMKRPYMFSTPRTKPSKSGLYLSLYMQYT